MTIQPDSDARDFSDTTYKVGLNWKINDNFRFRANTGTSFRTPALFELYRKNFHLKTAREIPTLVMSGAEWAGRWRYNPEDGCQLRLPRAFLTISIR